MYVLHKEGDKHMQNQKLTVKIEADGAKKFKKRIRKARKELKKFNRLLEQTTELIGQSKRWFS